MFSEEELGEILNKKVKKSKKEKKEKRNFKDTNADCGDSGAFCRSASDVISHSSVLSIGAPQGNYEDVIVDLNPQNNIKEHTVPTIIFAPRTVERYPTIGDTVADKESLDEDNGNYSRNTRSHAAITEDASSHLVEGLVKASEQRRRTIDLARIQNISQRTAADSGSSDAGRIAPIMTDGYRKFRIESAVAASGMSITTGSHTAHPSGTAGCSSVDTILAATSGDIGHTIPQQQTKLDIPVSDCDNDFFFYSPCSVPKQSDPTSSSAVFAAQDSGDKGYGLPVAMSHRPMDSSSIQHNQEEQYEAKGELEYKAVNATPITSGEDGTPLVRGINGPDLPSINPTERMQQLPVKRFERKRNRLERHRHFIEECYNPTTIKSFGLDFKRDYEQKISERLIDLMNT